MGRQPKCIAIVGTTGTGKSTFAHTLAPKLDTRILVVTYADNPKIWQPYQEVRSIKNANDLRFQGIKKATIVKHGGPKHFFDFIYKNFRNGVLLLDDCRQYIKANIEHVEGLKNAVISHRHLGLDMIFVVHSPTHIPVQARPFIKEAYLGRCTVLAPKSFEVENVELWRKAQLAINKKIKQSKNRFGVFAKIEL